MRFRLERRSVFQTDYVNVLTNQPVYTVTTHHTTRDATLEVMKHADSRSDEIARIRCRELFADTIELKGAGTSTIVSSPQNTEHAYTEVSGERMNLKAKKYVRKAGKNKWTIETPAAAIYTWTADTRELILRTEDSLEIAYIRPPKHGDDPATGFVTVFHVEEEVLADLDQIIVSGVYLKYKVDHKDPNPSVENKYMMGKTGSAAFAMMAS